MYYNFAAKLRLQRNKYNMEREIRIPVTKLRGYLNEVGLTITTLADLSGINRMHLSKCLAGEVDQRNGATRTLSDDNLVHLQDALHELSLRLKYIFIFYNSDLEVVKRNGKRYCKDCVDQIKHELSPYFAVLTFMQYALGWTRSKVRNVMDIRDGFAFGNISQDDVNRINVKLAGIAAQLDRLTLVKG